MDKTLKLYSLEAFETPSNTLEAGASCDRGRLGLTRSNADHSPVQGHLTSTINPQIFSFPRKCLRILSTPRKLNQTRRSSLERAETDRIPSICFEFNTVSTLTSNGFTLGRFLPNPEISASFRLALKPDSIILVFKNVILGCWLTSKEA